jgi:L-ascorbate metabolism protein UlaG (beta-lactamase superfamily)
MIKVIWTGAAGLRFETSNEIILIDPFYTRVNLFSSMFGSITPDETAIAQALPDTDMAKVTGVIVGHTHSDHALDVPTIISKSAAKLVGSRSLDTLMALSGQPGRTTVCSGGETIVLSDHAAVTMIRSAHGSVFMGKVPFAGKISSSARLPMKAGGYRAGTVFAPRLEIDGTAFVHVGSADFSEEAIQGHTCDVLFLCAAGWKKREGQAHRLIDITQPDVVVLIHYDDFSKPHREGAKTRKRLLLDVRGLVRNIKEHAPAINVVVPAINAVMSFG